MNKRIRIITFCTFVGILILIILGFWQLSRLKEKKLFLTAMQKNLNSPPINFEFLKDNLIYNKVKIIGHFLPNKDIHLYGRRSMSRQKDGYYLVTPFETTDKQVLLVIRGWFNSDNKNNVIKANNEARHEIVGVTMPSEKARSYLPANDLKNNVWLTLDLELAADSLKLNLLNFYIIQEGKDISNLDILLPLSINHLANVRNDHLEYVLTWFGLAISLTVIYIVYYRRNM